MKHTIWAKYAANYNVSLAKAIADRDEPMNRQECIQAFVDSSGIAPDESQIAEMHPDSEETIQEQVDYYKRNEI